jgi:hypothetical protein
MKKLYTVGLVNVVVCMTIAFWVPSASANGFSLLVWLSGGANVTAVLPVEDESELELVSLNVGGLGVATRLLCSGVLDGWVSSGSLDYVSEVLSLGGTAIPTTVLTGTALLCENSGGCTEPEVWADVPFESEVESMLAGTESVPVDLLVKAGWYQQCLVLGVTSAELCEFTEIATELVNEGNGTVKNVFSTTFQELAELKLAACTSGGLETGELNGSGSILESGVTLSVSME